MWRTTTRALLLAALAALALAGTAQAKQIQQYFYSGESFEVGVSSAAIAFDAADQSLLVTGDGKISRFSLTGVPKPFSGLSGATSFSGGGNVIAVDESNTASAGNFYTVSKDFQINGYAPSGTLLPGFPLPGTVGCGLTVAPDGHLWVASSGTYKEFTSNGTPTGRVLVAGATYAEGFGTGVCRIVIDASGNLYVAKSNRLIKYDPSFNFVRDLGTAQQSGFRSLSGSRGSPLLAFDRGSNSLFELFDSVTNPADPIVQVDSSGDPITAFGGPDPAHFSYEGLSKPQDFAVDPQTHKVYVLTGAGEVNVFARDPSVLTVPTTSADAVEDLSGTSATLTGTLDPDGIDTTDCRFEWGNPNVEEKALKYTHVTPCAEGNVFSAGSGSAQVSATISGLEMGGTYHFRLVSKNANGIAAPSADREFYAADPPAFGDVNANHITTDSARIDLEVNANGEKTGYHVEIGTDTSYGASFPIPDAIAPRTRPGLNFEGFIVNLTPQEKTQEVKGLAPNTLYHYRVVAENAAGKTEGTDHVFRTFALPGSGEDKCPNAQARQQTSSAGLLECRAYELVSAPSTGGYDVRSDLSSGVSALATSPQASDAALYSMQSGTIPGIAGHPTNRGADPYVATRGANGWSTRYVGLPSNNPFASGPFASPLSGSDSALDAFAFGGAEICDPCFEDGSTDVPLRLPDGTLVQGMAGSMDPGPADPAGTVAKPLSADGSHFIFATTAQFEPNANSNGTDPTIYSRDLEAGTTEVVSTDETGTAIANGEDVAALDVSKDGSRVVIGELISTDAAGNEHYHLYLHIAGTEESVDLMPGATQGALYSGMSQDGTKLFFTTPEALGAGESDESADVYVAEVSGPGAITPQRISTGTEGTGDTDLCSPPGDPNNWNAVSGDGKCNAVAFAGGAGVASQSGDFYFLSPERLDGPANGTQDQANLYLVDAGSSTPHFVATIDSSAVKPPPAPPTRPVVSTEFGGSHSNPQAMSVDQSNGDVYVTEGSGTLSRYTEAGAPKNFTEGPGEGTNTISGLSYVESAPEVAIDNSGGLLDGNIYVTNYSSVKIFSPSGAPLGELSGFSEACGVAVDQSNGDVYVGDYGSVRRFTPTSATPPVSNASYAPATGISASEVCAVAADDGNVYAATWPSGPVRQYSSSEFEAGLPFASGTFVNSSANALSVDPVTHELYVDEGTQIATFDPAGEKQLTIGSGLSNSRGVAVNATSHHVYAASGVSVTEFGYEFTPYEPIDNPAIVHAVRQAGTYDSSDFEVTPDGRYAAFTSIMPLDGYDSAGHYEAFRYEAEGNGPACVSCSFTTARPTSDATLTPHGLSLTEDGRVFFTTVEQLTLRDTNEKTDAYEWSDGKQELISTGTSPADSELLSVSADGKDAFFFTREKLVPEDNNGSSVRLYTARENGGFAFGPPQFQCAASDECHGASTAPPAPLGAATTGGEPGQFKEQAKAKCRKGKVKRRGKCVSRKQHKRQNHKRAAKTTRGGDK